MHHGVPQGSVLGPLLFLLYINDLHESILYSNTYHFADDTNLLNINSSPKKMQKQINIDLKLLYKWLIANKISLNCTKTELIIFKKPNTSINFNFNIQLNGNKLQRTDCVKYLGVYLDEYVNGKLHCKEILKKLIRANGMLAKIRHYVSTKELIAVYHSIFSTHLLYGCQYWGQVPHNLARKIFLQQKKALRIMSFSDFQAHTSTLFKQYKLLKLDDLISLNNILFVHDFLTRKLPKSFSTFFKKLPKFTKYLLEMPVVASGYHLLSLSNMDCTLLIENVLMIGTHLQLILYLTHTQPQNIL